MQLAECESSENCPAEEGDNDPSVNIELPQVRFVHSSTNQSNITNAPRDVSGSQNVTTVSTRHDVEGDEAIPTLMLIRFGSQMTSQQRGK
jgi:hypothetical protein